MLVGELIGPLLVLQERDGRCDTIQGQLAFIPEEIAKTEREIAVEEAKISAAAQAVKDLELQRREKEREVEEVNAQIVRYKNQQLSVKKNEEYQALTQEIEESEAKIAEIEDAELELMEDVEAAQKHAAQAESEGEERINVLRAHIETQQRNELAAKSELGEAKTAVQQAREDVPEAHRKQYDFVKRQVKRAPYIVPLEDGKCGGCHLRVSNEVEAGARKGESITRCDNCGRIVYWIR